MPQFKRPKYSKSKSAEKRELGVLEKLLNESDLLTKLTRGDDDFPTIDGYIHLLNKEREILGQVLHVQIKPVKYKTNGNPYSVCKAELLAYAYEASTPVLLIGVDVEKEVAYWAYLSPESAEVFFNEPGEKKSTSINFDSRNIIRESRSDLVDEWLRICLHHRNESNDKIMSRLIRKRQKEPVERQISLVSLDTLNDLILYRTNVGKYPFFDYALSLAPEVCKRDERAKLRYMEILERIYYYKTAEVLKALLDLTLDETDSVSDKAKKVLLEVSKYNFHVLNSLGYRPHRLLVDAIPDFTTRGGVRAAGLAREILQNALSSSFEGTSHPDHITITFHRGPLQPSKYLQKIRKDAIQLLFSLLDETGDVAEKLAILTAVFHGLHSPDQAHADEESRQQYIEMVNTEAEDIIKRYRKMAFPSAHTVGDEYPVLYEIEHQMAWLKTWGRGVKGLDELLDALRDAKSDYAFYRVVYGEAHEISPDEGFDTGQHKREKEIQKYLDTVTEENVEEWQERLARVAKFSLVLKDARDSWKFNHLRDFLGRIGKHKPEVADRILSLTFSKHDALLSLAGNILFGLRQSAIPLWDKYVSKIEDEQSEELVTAVLTSFEFHQPSEVKKRVRPRDIELLNCIVRQDGKFSFLKEKRGRLFLYHCMRAALYVYKADPKQCRALIVGLFRSYPEELNLFFDQMSFALWDKAMWLTLDEWGEEELSVLGDALVSVERIDHNEEQVLLRLGQRDFDAMISVLDGRLERELKEKSDFSISPPRISRYEAIPHHFYNQELRTFTAEHPGYRKVLVRWIDSLTEENIATRFSLGKLIRFIDGVALTEEIEKLVASGDKENLKKVLALFPAMNPPDFGLCFRIIEVTDDEEILGRIGGKMRNLGVMGGAYGDDIYGNGLRAIKERLEREGLTHPSPKVQDFSREMIRDLERDIAISGEKNRERLKRDKEEFEDSDE